MAQVQITLEFDTHEDPTPVQLSSLLDDLHAATEDLGDAPAFGVVVDGRQLDPDDLSSGFMS